MSVTMTLVRYHVLGVELCSIKARWNRSLPLHDVWIHRYSDACSAAMHFRDLQCHASALMPCSILPIVMLLPAVRSSQRDFMEKLMALRTIKPKEDCRHGRFQEISSMT